jgi:hypothetical protein
VSDVAARVRAVGEAIAAGSVPADADGARVVLRPDGTPNTVELDPPPGLTLSALEAALGEGHPVPKARPGPARTSFSGDGWSLLASHDADGAVAGLTVVRQT